MVIPIEVGVPVAFPGGDGVVVGVPAAGVFVASVDVAAIVPAKGVWVGVDVLLAAAVADGGAVVFTVGVGAGLALVGVLFGGGGAGGRAPTPDPAPLVGLS